MQTVVYNFYIIGVYDPLYSPAHPMKYLESDIIVSTDMLYFAGTKQALCSYCSVIALLCLQCSDSGELWLEKL